MYDVIVVGGGPAGMSATLYTLRNGKTVLLLEKTTFGGQMTHSPKIENYPPFLQISGNELAEKMLDQIISQGADIELEQVISVEDGPEFKTVRTDSGRCFEGRTVILATGVRHRMLGLEGEEDLVGEGISYCAVCDGDFYFDQVVCVAGGGNSALQEALLLADSCKNVIILQDLPHCTGEQKLLELLRRKPNVRIRTSIRILSLCTGEHGLSGLEVENTLTGDRSHIDCEGLFVAIGLIPENDPFANVARLTERGYFDSGEDCLTGTPGIFVAGDCRRKTVRQITTACADGAVAALAACHYLDMQD